MRIFIAVVVITMVLAPTVQVSCDEDQEMYLGGHLSWIDLKDIRLTEENSLGWGVFLQIPSSKDWFHRLSIDVYGELELDSSDVDLVFISASTNYLFPIHGETWHPFLGTGITYHSFDADSPLDIDDAFGWYNSAGVLWDVSKTVQLTAEFRYQKAGPDARSDGVSIPDFDADGWSILVGLSYAIF